MPLHVGGYCSVFVHNLLLVFRAPYFWDMWYNILEIIVVLNFVFSVGFFSMNHYFSYPSTSVYAVGETNVPIDL